MNVETLHNASGDGAAAPFDVNKMTTVPTETAASNGLEMPPVASEITVFVGNIPPDVPYCQLLSVVSGFGGVVRVSYSPLRGWWAYARVTLDSVETAEKLEASIHGKRAFEGREFHRLVSCRITEEGSVASSNSLASDKNRTSGRKGIGPKRRKATFSLLRDGPPGGNLFVYGIPLEWCELELMELVALYGHIVGIRVPHSGAKNMNRGFGFVSYDSHWSARNAFLALSNITVAGKLLRLQMKNGEEHFLPAEAQMSKNSGGWERPFGSSRNFYYEEENPGEMSHNCGTASHSFYGPGSGPRSRHFRSNSHFGRPSPIPTGFASSRCSSTSGASQPTDLTETHTHSGEMWGGNYGPPPPQDSYHLDTSSYDWKIRAGHVQHQGLTIPPPPPLAFPQADEDPADVSFILPPGYSEKDISVQNWSARSNFQRDEQLCEWNRTSGSSGKSSEHHIWGQPNFFSSWKWFQTDGLSADCDNAFLTASLERKLRQSRHFDTLPSSPTVSELVAGSQQPSKAGVSEEVSSNSDPAGCGSSDGLPNILEDTDKGSNNTAGPAFSRSKADPKPNGNNGTWQTLLAQNGSRAENGGSDVRVKAGNAERILNTKAEGHFSWDFSISGGSLDFGVNQLKPVSTSASHDYNVIATGYSRAEDGLGAKAQDGNPIQGATEGDGEGADDCAGFFSLARQASNFQILPPIFSKSLEVALSSFGSAATDRECSTVLLPLQQPIKQVGEDVSARDGSIAGGSTRLNVLLGGGNCSEESVGHPSQPFGCGFPGTRETVAPETQAQVYEELSNLGRQGLAKSTSVPNCGQAVMTGKMRVAAVGADVSGSSTTCDNASSSSGSVLCSESNRSGHGTSHGPQEKLDGSLAIPEAEVISEAVGEEKLSVQRRVGETRAHKNLSSAIDEEKGEISGNNAPDLTEVGETSPIGGRVSQSVVPGGDTELLTSTENRKAAFVDLPQVGRKERFCTPRSSAPSSPSSLFASPPPSLLLLSSRAGSSLSQLLPASHAGIQGCHQTSSAWSRLSTTDSSAEKNCEAGNGNFGAEFDRKDSKECGFHAAPKMADLDAVSASRLLQELDQRKASASDNTSISKLKEQFKFSFPAANQPVLTSLLPYERDFSIKQSRASAFDGGSVSHLNAAFAVQGKESRQHQTEIEALCNEIRALEVMKKEKYRLLLAKSKIQQPLDAPNVDRHTLIATRQQVMELPG